jgi:hypothetical protein
LLKLSADPAEPALSVAATLAITPAEMVVVFVPAATHVNDPALAEQDKLFPAPVSSVVAAALIDVIAEAGYWNVHCSALAEDPCGDHVRSHVTAPLEASAGEESVNAAPACALTAAHVSTRPTTSFIVPRVMRMKSGA